MSFLGDVVSKVRLDSHDAEKSAEGLSERFEKLQHTLELVAGVELFRGARELGNVILEKLKGPSEYADRILSMSAAAGLGVEQLQKLQFSAQQNGVSAENASMSLVHLNRTIEESREGSKEATAAFGKLGISPEQVKGFADSDEALMAITDRLKNLPDPVQRSALAMQIFGRSGAAQLKWLASGSEEMETMKKRAQDLGAVVSETDTKNLNEMGDIIESVGTAIKGFVSTLTARLAPSIIWVVQKIEDWWIANRKLIQSGLEKWIDNFLYWAGYLAGVITVIVGKIADWAAAHKYLYDAVKQLVDDAFANLFSAGAAVIKWVGDFIDSNSELVETLIEIGAFVGAVAVGVAAWTALAGGILSFSAALIKVKEVMAAIDVATAIASFEVWGIVAAVTALTVALVTAYQMLFQHKSFDETTLGQFSSGVHNFVGMFTGKKKAGDTEDLGDGAGTPFGDRIAAYAKGGSNFSMLGNYAAQNGVPSALAPAPAYAVAASAAPQTVTLNAPFTFNAASPNADPETMRAEFNKTTKEFLESKYRQAQRATQPNVRH